MKTFDPNNSGKIKMLVEECQCISITAYMKQVMPKLKNALLTAQIEMDNRVIELTPSKTAFGGIRFWFKCPKCGERVGTLFVHPLSSEIGCRKCLGLEYRSRRYKGMIEDATKP
jgi:RecJ-like exonuclease